MPLAYFFRPRFDLATEYMHSWLGLAMGDVAGLGYQVIDSSGPYATPYSFHNTMQRYNPDLVVADGHGDINSLTGQGLQEFLRACFNNEVLSGKVMCAASCLTGQGLGPDSRNKKADGYIGFVNEFSWVVSPPYTPSMDPVALPFQEVIRKLVRLSAEYQQEKIPLRDVYNGIVNEFEKWEKYYSVPPASEDPYARDILLSLRHDKTGLITLGEEGRIVSPVVALQSLVVPISFGVASLLLPEYLGV